MELNVTDYEKFINMVSDSTLWTFKELVKFWCNIKDEYPIWKGYSNTPAFYNYLSNKITNHNILNAEMGVRIQLSIIPDAKGTCKNIF